MRNRGRTRRCGRRWAAAGVGGLAPALTGHDILTITDPTQSAIPVVTTAAAHGITGGPVSVVISGSSVAAYNTTWDATEVDATSFSLALASEYPGDATGGTWELA